MMKVLTPASCEPPQLVGEKPRRLHRRLFAVVKVAGDHERVDLLRQAEINHGDKGFSRRPADQLGELRIAQRQRRQRRIEMDVGGMNELESHGRNRALNSETGEVTALGPRSAVDKPPPLSQRPRSGIDARLSGQATAFVLSRIWIC